MRRAARPLALLLLFLQCVRCEHFRLAPWFEQEPATVVVYEAAAGGAAHCAARGRPPPARVWLDAAGAPLTDQTNVRRVYENGTLVVWGERSEVVRCRAHNEHGAAVSRDVRLLGVMGGAARWGVSAAPAHQGGVAAIICHRTTHVAATQSPLWYKDDRLIALDPPHQGARLVPAGDVLLVGDAGAQDAGRYACGERGEWGAARGGLSATLDVTIRTASSAPRLVASAGEVTATQGTDFCMPCVSSEHPPPHYTWYREWNGRLQPVEPVSGLWLWRGGAALCVAGARPALSGAWLCKAYNVFGEATARVTVSVTAPLQVTVAPHLVVAAHGATVRLNCSASDAGVTFAWTHDATPAAHGPDLVLQDLARHHTGLYQCFARRGADSAQDSAEVRLGESPPELQYTFIEQALRGGGEVSLRCAAWGAPPPRFTWLLDGAPLDARRPRLVLTEGVAPGGAVLATLNITGATPADGGRYTCRAHNRLGHLDHSARLNIYGPPSIRALGPVRVVAGANATIYCPYAGYPISSISWWMRGSSVALGSGGGRVAARGAELRLTPALQQDAGHYACAVAAPDGQAARQDIEIQIRNPPKISPFMFSTELTEGSSVQVLCGVSSGDKPMYFSWLKDGEPLPPSLQIEEKSLNEFSLLMFTELSAGHSGEYTCRVSNHAAVVNYTATLSVKVAPVWVTEPLDAAVLLGAPVLLECAAKGYPPPTITWYRKNAEDGGNLDGETDEGQWEPISARWGDAGEGLGARGGGALTARGATRALVGLYRCSADNGVGPPLLKTVNITVHEPAHFEDMGGNVSCVVGRGATLSCVARGDHPLAVHWSRGGTRVDLNEYRWAVSEMRTANGLRSTLQLRAAEKSDAGEYRCHAHNEYGRSEILLYLHVEEPPSAPRSVHLGGVGSRWMRVTWRAASSAHMYRSRLTPLVGPSALLFTNLTLEPSTAGPGADGVTTLSSRIEGLKPAVVYSLRLLAENHVGQSPPSEPLTFTTLEEIPAAAPQNVRVKSGNPGELHLSWSAPPQDSWNGEVLGYAATWRASDGEVGGGRATAPGWSSAELTVGGLQGGARYAITLRAYNRAGPGPAAPTLYLTTTEGVPENAPSSVSCEALSSRSLRVRWSPTDRDRVRGYEVHYAPIVAPPSSIAGSSEGGADVARRVVGTEATLQALRPRTNYSVWVRARSDAGLGPCAHPVYCATVEDVPGAVNTVAALAAGEDTVRVTWLAPPMRAARVTHYTLTTRELGKSAGEWSQRVEAGSEEEEVYREVRGLRPAVYEVWVRAHAEIGAGPASRVLTAAPAVPVSARISSFGRVVYATRGSRIRLRCAAVGTPPIRWRWSPLPQSHTVTDTGDLIVHMVVSEVGTNYTCSVANAGGSDARVSTVRVVSPPPAPTPRLVRAESYALHVAWDAPPPTPAHPTLGYTVSWSREGAAGGESGAAHLPAADTAVAVRTLACGALYRITVRADNAVGASPPSRALLARTKGDKAAAAPGKEFVWANSSMLRLNLLAWRARCAVTAWRVALRGPGTAGAGGWRQLVTDGETAEATDLSPGTWYEVNVVAHSPAGDTTALYRAATHTLAGERLGEAIEVAHSSGTGDAADVSDAGAGGEPWRGGAGAGVAACALGALLAAGAAAVALRHRAAHCLPHRDCGPPHDTDVVQRHHLQLYTTEPGKRNGKTLTPPDGDLHEISPYATFSMTDAVGGGGGGGGGCALHLHTFARAESLDLAAPPPRPNLVSHHAEYGVSMSSHTARTASRESDSESSGSPCAACAADLYRLHLPPGESSAEERRPPPPPASHPVAPRHHRRRPRDRRPLSAKTATGRSGTPRMTGGGYAPTRLLPT